MPNAIVLNPDTGPTNIGLGCRTPVPWARQTARPKGLGPAPYHPQQTWVRRPFPVISFLGLKKVVRPKLTTTTTTTIIIDFTLQIKSIFFFHSNNINFKFNNTNESSIVIIFFKKLLMMMIINSSNLNSYSF